MDTQELLGLYETMALIREAQEAICREYHGDEIKTPCHLGIGLEAISAGVAHCLPPGSYAFGQLRNHGQYLAMSGETDKYFGELFGRVTGTGKGKAGSMHLMSPEHGFIGTSGIVAGTISHAVGAGLALAYNEAITLDGNDPAEIARRRPVAVAQFGDAAIEEGEFWESLNFACLHRLPVLFVCEDNGWAIHTPRTQRSGWHGYRSPIDGFDCYTAEADGADVEQVVNRVSTFLKAMVRDPKPTVFRFKCFRFLEHCGPNLDWDAGYRSMPGAEDLKRWDPLHRAEVELIPMLGGEVVEAQSYLKTIRERQRSRVEQSMAAARAAVLPGTLDELYEGVLA